MGIKQSHLLISKKYTKNLPYSDLDKLIYLIYEFIKNEISLKTIETKFSYINLDELQDLKKNEHKRKKFINWYKIWIKYDEYQKIDKINIENISPYTQFKSSINIKNDNFKLTPIESFNSRNIDKGDSINNINKNNYKNNNNKIQTSLTSRNTSNSKYINNNEEEISQCEKSLRKYYINNKKEYIKMSISGPSEPFRFVNWLVCSNIPEKRKFSYFENILKFSLDKNLNHLINKDIRRTMQENLIYNEDIYLSLYKILKSIALLDKKLSYCQGMNFICGFMLIISEGNELDCFYLAMGLFSNTFCQKYNCRGFFIENFPLLKLYIYIFKILLKKKLKKIYEFFENFEFFYDLFITKWFQTLFVHILPVENVVRIWDCIFAYGLNFLISISLSLIDYLKNYYIKFEEEEEIREFFDSLNYNENNNKNNFHQSKTDFIQYNCNDIIYKKNTNNKNIKNYKNNNKIFIDIEIIIENAEKNFLILDEEYEIYKTNFLEEESDIKNFDEIKLKYDYENFKNFEEYQKEENLKKLNQKLKQKQLNENKNNQIIQEQIKLKNEENLNIMKQINEIMRNKTDSHDISIDKRELNQIRFKNK